MAQTENVCLRGRLFNTKKTDGNCLCLSHRDVKNIEGDDKKNDVNIKAESLSSVPQRFNCIGLELPFHSRIDRDNTIFKDAEYFLKHYVYKLIPITFGGKDDKKESAKKCSGIVVEEIDEKIISLEHDYCSVSSESDGEFEFSRTISYQVYKKRSRSKKRGRIKQTDNNVKESPNGTNEIDISTKCSNADLHLIQPDYSEISFYSKNLFSYKEESHSESLQPIALHLSLPEEEKTEDNGIASPTENNEENGNTAILSPITVTNLSAPSILSPTENNDMKEDAKTHFSSETILSPTDENTEKENTETKLNPPIISSCSENIEEKVTAPTDNEEKDKEDEELRMPVTSPVKNHGDVKDASAELSIPKYNAGENDDIEIRFSRPGFDDYKPSKQFIDNIAKKVPELLKDRSDKVNILDCTYGFVNSQNNKISYYFISEEIWRLFTNSSERIVLTNDTNCGERMNVNKNNDKNCDEGVNVYEENNIPTFLVFDESSLVDVLKTICKDIGYKYHFTLLEDSGEKLVKVLENKDCGEEEKELEESELSRNKKCDEQPLGFINSGKLRNLLVKSSRLRKQVGESGNTCQTSLNSNHKLLPLKKSWKRDDLLLVQNAQERVVELWENSKKKAKKKSKRYGVINSGILRRILLKDNLFMKHSQNLVNGISVNQNDFMCSQIPVASHKVKKNKRENKKDERKKSKSKKKRSQEMSGDGIVDLGLHLGKRTGFGEEELIITKKKKKKKGRKNEKSEYNRVISKSTDNLKENNSILCRLLQEPVKNDYVPEYQSTEYYLDEKSGILSVRNVIDRNKLEKALLSEKMREVRIGGLKKKRELKNKEQSNVKVKKSQKKEKRTENCEMKISHLIENVVKNSIMGFPSASVQVREPPCSNSIQIRGAINYNQLEERKNDKYKPGAIVGKSKTRKLDKNGMPFKRGRPRKDQIIVTAPKDQKNFTAPMVIPEIEKIRRLSSDSDGGKLRKIDGGKGQGRPRKNSDLYAQCYMFDPSFNMENQPQERNMQFLEKENQAGIKEGKQSKSKKEKRKHKDKERANETERVFSVKVESKDHLYSKLGANNCRSSEAKGVNPNGNIEKNLALANALGKLESYCETMQNSFAVASDESTITAFNDSREEPFWLNDAEEKTYRNNEQEQNKYEVDEKDKKDESEESDKNDRVDEECKKDEKEESDKKDKKEESDKKDEKEESDEKDEEDLKELKDDPLIPILTVLGDESHIPFYLNARKKSKAREAEKEASGNTPIPNRNSKSPELEKGEVCFASDLVETAEDRNEPLLDVSTSEIKEAPCTEKIKLEPKDVNEEDIPEENFGLNEIIKKETKKSTLKRKSNSKTKTKKAKKRVKTEIVDQCKYPVVSLVKIDATPTLLKTSIIAKKGELLIETNKIFSPVVQIEKNKEIEEAISKQLEENALNLVRSSSRPRKMPRIFDESEYAIVTPIKKVKKSPEKNVDPDYQPKMKTRKGSLTNTPTPAKVPSTKKLSVSSENDSEVDLQRIIDLAEKKNRVEPLFDPLSLNYERTTRSGARFENANSLNESELEVVLVIKNSPVNNKNNSKKISVGDTKGNNSTVKRPEQRTVSTRSSRNSRNTRLSAKLKNF